MKNLEEKVLKKAVVCLLVKKGEVFLGLKTKKIGAECRNGPGGGIENETILEAVIRETEEETGKKSGKEFITVSAENLELVAIIDFHNTKTDNSTFVCKVYFFIARDWTGTFNDTDEMIDYRPYKTDNLPLNEMMPADKEFFPLILNGKKIIGKAYYGPYQKELLAPVEIQEVDSFPED